MVTLKDIAEQAGVSSMTVSRVMNGKTKDVSQKTAQRIKKIAEPIDAVNGYGEADGYPSD